MASTWDTPDFDLDAYLARIGFIGERAPTERTLRELQRRHVLSIPFENLEIILGRPVLLDLPSLQAKLVRQRRGGYCFEHSTLFAAALERLGFGVTGLAARVRMGQEGRLLPTTHAVLRVSTRETPATGREWLCDVGFGRNALEPAEFTDGAEVSEGGWRFRLVRESTDPVEVWVWRTLVGGEAHDAHAFPLLPQYPVDYAVGNHWVSTTPRSPFVTGLRVQRVEPGVQYALDGQRVTALRPDGRTEVREVEPAEVPKVLEHTFGIELDTADRAALVHRLEADRA
ncbi:arylamine N-acetyltransferase [Streptomyces sp. 549]|uniref:arylamine N-acetyltransferase family protein n=1 Tax=Streptomyces sp. 549 TaxID=3049076 RepID=UPI0024C26E24|nr:arylamine N-acetyltransferase [Streptomyces sp. 549]MDK1476024.1 arylamine N-acetyltransferase [Streptomyces sp. 549]